MTEGAACRFCGATAVACQHVFVASYGSRRRWCCRACGVTGPAKAHVIESLVTDQMTDEER